MAQASKKVYRNAMDEPILEILRYFQETQEFYVTSGAVVTHSTVKAEGVMTMFRDGKAEQKEFHLLANYDWEEDDIYYDRWEPKVVVKDVEENVIPWDEFESADERSYRSVQINKWGPL